MLAYFSFLGPGYGSGSPHGRSPVAGHSVCAETQDRPVGGLLCRPVWGPDCTHPLPGSCGPVAVPVLGLRASRHLCPQNWRGSSRRCSRTLASPRHHFEAFTTFTFQPVSAGFPRLPGGAIVGIPASFLRGPVSTTDRPVVVHGSECNLAEPSRRRLRDAPTLSHDAQKFALAKECGVPGEWGSRLAGPACPSLPAGTWALGVGASTLGALREAPRSRGPLSTSGGSSGGPGLCLLHGLSHSRPGSSGWTPRPPCLQPMPGVGWNSTRRFCQATWPFAVCWASWGRNSTPPAGMSFPDTVPHQTPALPRPDSSAADVAGSAWPAAPEGLRAQTAPRLRQVPLPPWTQASPQPSVSRLAGFGV